MKYNLKRHKVIQPRDKSIRLIPLTHGINTIVDADDYDFLMQWNWYALKTRIGFYAARCDDSSNLILMHRILINNKAKYTDHIDRNTLNNRRKNLRPCTRSQNAANQPKHKDNTSGYKGVHFYKRTKKWLAQIKVNYRCLNLGYFSTAEEAAEAYKKAAKKHFGKFAKY